MEGMKAITRIVPIQHVVRTNDLRHDNSSSGQNTSSAQVDTFEHAMNRAKSMQNSSPEVSASPMISNYDKDAREIFYYMNRKADFKC